MSDNLVIVTAPESILLTVTPPEVHTIIVSQVGVQGPSGPPSSISSDANNALTVGSDNGLYLTSKTDLGTFN